MLIDELLVVCDDRLADGLTNSVDLGCVSTTGNSNSDVDIGELVKTNDEERFVDLESQDLWLDEVEGLAVNLDKTFASLISPYCQYSPIACERRGRVIRTLQWATAVAIQQFVSTSPKLQIREFANTCLLLAEALNALRGGHDCVFVGGEFVQESS